MSITLNDVQSDKDLRPLLRGVVRDAITTYGDFTQIIHSQLKHIVRDMVRSCHFFQGLKEDQITFHIISQFNSLGFRATHDPQIGGHVDICVEHEDYLWLAEAKIHSGYTNLQRGWEQLVSRYSTGMENEDDGAFIIYNFNQRAINVTREWRGVLAEIYPEVEIEFAEGELDFNTSHAHERTGRTYRVKHYNIPLYHNPRDRDI